MAPLSTVTLVLLLLKSVAIATASVNFSLPLVEPTLNAGQRSLLNELANAVRDTAWPGDGGRVVDNAAGRRLFEADPETLRRAVAGRELVVTSATSEVLRQAANATTGLAVSQPLTTLDACLIWRRQASTTATVGLNRDGMYFLTVFHSSVWSVLLLCLLLSISFLTILEAVHPIGMRSSHARRLNRISGEKPMGAFHVLAFSTGALLLIGYPRSPRSTAGRVLGIIWWLFAFTIAIAYLSATVLVFLTTRGEPVSASAGLAEILSPGQSTGRTVLCAAGEPLCADWARPEPLTRANFTHVTSDSAGLEQLLQQPPSEAEPPLLLLTHQFACANLLAADTNQSYSLGFVAQSVAWIGLAGPSDLVRQADSSIVRLLANGRLAQLENQLASVGVYNAIDTASKGLVSEWLSELRLGLPYRIGSFYGPLLLLLIGFGLTLLVTISEFCYYRFYYEPENDDVEDETDVKVRARSVGATMDTYL